MVHGPHCTTVSVLPKYEQFSKWFGTKDWFIRQLQDNCLWMRRRRTRKFDVQLLYISSVFISWGTKEKELWFVTTTGHSVFHYWIVVVTLHNADFTCKFPCLCFTCILLVELWDKVGKSKKKCIMVVYFFHDRYLAWELRSTWTHCCQRADRKIRRFWTKW